MIFPFYFQYKNSIYIFHNVIYILFYDIHMNLNKINFDNILKVYVFYSIYIMIIMEYKLRFHSLILMQLIVRIIVLNMSKTKITLRIMQIQKKLMIKKKIKTMIVTKNEQHYIVPIMKKKKM